MEPQINREVVTEGGNFVWIPTGHVFGVPSGLTGWWNGEYGEGCKFITFPQGTVNVSLSATLYKPTDEEIDAAIAERQEEGKGDWDTRSQEAEAEAEGGGE